MKIQDPKSFYLEKGINYLKENSYDIHFNFIKDSDRWVLNQNFYTFLLSRHIDTQIKKISKDLYFSEINRKNLYDTTQYWRYLHYSRTKPKISISKRFKTIKCLYKIFKHKYRIILYLIFRVILPILTVILMVSNIRPHSLWTLLYYLSTLNIVIQTLLTLKKVKK